MENIIKQLREPLKIEDIDFRVQSISAPKGFATILAYKDARVDMNRLDDVCGGLWQAKYELIDKQLFCSIGVKIGEEWVWRQDVGVESMAEAQKGRASDAFKRAGFRWGIGRELYDYPRITLMLKTNEFSVQNGKARQTYDLELNKWKWKLIRNKDGGISQLTAYDQNNQLRYDSLKDYNGAPGNATQKPTKKVEAPSTVKKNKPKIDLVLFDEIGSPTETYKTIESAISEGHKITIEEMGKRYILTPINIKELEQHFKIK